MKTIAILGSTGSIGTQTLEVVAAHRDRFAVAALAAHSNDALLEKQIAAFQPRVAVLADEAAARRLAARYDGPTKILGGKVGVLAAATQPEADVVVTSMVGFAGLEPTIAAIRAGKDIALANKETLVVAGELVMALAKENDVAVLPVDSEHSAIFQCLEGQDRAALHKIWLTASGGPFRGLRRGDLEAVTVERCLKHPNWTMGQKITVDSATLANKGLEVIEAKWLYGVSYDRIQVVVHPQSIVHSMVEFEDGAVLAQLGLPDMRVPIQYALTYPQRLPAPFPKADFWQMRDLTFEAPDLETFEALRLAYEAGQRGGTMPCVFNAANEIAVGAFLHKKLSFLGIYEVIRCAMHAHTAVERPDLGALFEADVWARAYASTWIESR